MEVLREAGVISRSRSKGKGKKPKHIVFVDDDEEGADLLSFLLQRNQLTSRLQRNDTNLAEYLPALEQIRIWKSQAMIWVGKSQKTE